MSDEMMYHFPLHRLLWHQGHSIFIFNKESKQSLGLCVLEFCHQSTKSSTGNQKRGVHIRLYSHFIKQWPIEKRVYSRILNNMYLWSNHQHLDRYHFKRWFPNKKKKKKEDQLRLSMIGESSGYWCIQVIRQTTFLSFIMAYSATWATESQSSACRWIVLNDGTTWPG